MADPFLLDQKEVEVTLRKLEDAVNVRRQMQKEQRSEFSDSLEYEFQGVESSIRNGIRDVKWSLDDLEETLKLMSENRGHFIDSEDQKSRRSFLESARKALADIEFEVSSPPLHAVIEQQELQISSAKNCANDAPANQSAEPASMRSQSEEAIELLRAESEEHVVFSKSMIAHQEQKPQNQKPVATMVSLNLDTVRDLIEPPGYRRSLKSLVNALIRYRCWLFLAFLLLFFFVLVIIKAAARARSDMDATTTAATTTECAMDNMNCI